MGLMQPQMDDHISSNKKIREIIWTHLIRRNRLKMDVWLHCLVVETATDYGQKSGQFEYYLC